MRGTKMIPEGSLDCGGATEGRLCNKHSNQLARWAKRQGLGEQDEANPVPEEETGRGEGREEQDPAPKEPVIKELQRLQLALAASLGVSLNTVGPLARVSWSQIVKKLAEGGEGPGRKRVTNCLSEFYHCFLTELAVKMAEGEIEEGGTKEEGKEKEKEKGKRRSNKNQPREAAKPQILEGEMGTLAVGAADAFSLHLQRHVQISQGLSLSSPPPPGAWRGCLLSPKSSSTAGPR
jgi:hypothetical protein